MTRVQPDGQVDIPAVGERVPFPVGRRPLRYELEATGQPGHPYALHGPRGAHYHAFPHVQQRHPGLRTFFLVSDRMKVDPLRGFLLVEVEGRRVGYVW